MRLVSTYFPSSPWSSASLFSARFLRRLCGLAFAGLLTAAVAPAQTAQVGAGWVQHTPASSPSARYQAAFAYDPATGNAVLFGGQTDIGTFNSETWVWDGSNWTQLSPAHSPSARADASMVYDAATGNVVLFGGLTGGSTYNNETWTWNGTDWTQLSPSTKPSVREGGAMAYDATHRNVVLFGGRSTIALQDTYTWDGTTWTSLAPATKPAMRTDAGMAYDAVHGNVVLFGGNSASTYQSDTYTWDGTNWTAQSPSTVPTKRTSPMMVYDAASGKVVLFGGTTPITGPLSDTWVWDGTNWTQQSFSTAPSARASAAATYDTARATMVIFGGSTATSGVFLSETWTYDAGSFVAPTTAVGTAAAQTPVFFSITADGTLPALSNSNVLLQGTSGKDFTLGTGSDCTGAVTAGSTCTVNVAFTPTAPGMRQGAVDLLDGSGNVLATAFVSGTGTGPQATISPGVSSTYAGSLDPCLTDSCGDGGAATSAELYTPEGMAFDGAGNMYIADTGDYGVRKVNAATGVITTVAGSFTYCSDPTTPCGDGGLATDANAQFQAPVSVALDGAGNLYIADVYANRVRKVSAATGILSTVAGTGVPCSSGCGDGGAASSAGLNYPYWVTVDGAGNLYIADSGSNSIREILPSGIITTVSGLNGTLNDPVSVVADSQGNLYISDFGDNRIVLYTASTGTKTTFAGTGTACSSPTASCGDGGLAVNAQLNGPYGTTLDAAGNLYIADYYDNRIRKVSKATGYISTVSGNGAQCIADPGTCGDGQSATTATLDNPTAVAVDGAGNLYIGDGDDIYNQGDMRVRKMSVAGSIAFPTVTAAGNPDTTDGTRTLMLNNVGNLPLTIASMQNNSTNFVLGNPLSGGCSTTVAIGDSCLLGEEFSPAAGSGSVVVGSLAVTDNSLNAASAVQRVPLTGTVSAGGLIVTVGSVGAAAGTSSVALAASVGYGGSSLPTGAVTFTVGGSSTGVGTVTCKAKASHLNCTASYNASSLTAGTYTIAASVASDSNYSAGSGSSSLVISGTGSGAHVSPVTMVTPPAMVTVGSASRVLVPVSSSVPAVTDVPAALAPDATATADTDNSSCLTDAQTSCPAAEKAVDSTR